LINFQYAVIDHGFVQYNSEQSNLNIWVFFSLLLSHVVMLLFLHSFYVYCIVLLYALSPLHTFPRNFPVNGEVANLLQTCCGLVSDTANMSATSLQQVGNESL